MQRGCHGLPVSCQLLLCHYIYMRMRRAIHGTMEHWNFVCATRPMLAPARAQGRARRPPTTGGGLAGCGREVARADHQRPPSLGVW